MFIKIFIILVSVYIIILALIMIFANRFIFFPPAPGYQDTDKNIIKLTLPNGLRISALYLHNPKARYTLLYSHGNAEDLGTVRYRIANYLDAGLSVFTYDYPGYGTSQGHPNETTVYQSILTAYRYLTEDLAISPSNIIAYGFSVGCAPTLELATQKPLAGIILQSPFLSALRVVTYVTVFPWDVFDNYKKIDQIKSPILIYNGAADEIIPPYHGRILWKKAPERKTYIEIPQADHNNFIHLSGQAYWDALHQFIKSLEQQRVTQKIFE